LGGLEHVLLAGLNNLDLSAREGIGEHPEIGEVTSKLNFPGHSSQFQ
jgi:hypothetical protein